MTSAQSRNGTSIPMATDPLWDEPEESLYNKKKRYNLPHMDGSPYPMGYMRCTNLAGAFADQKALMDWREGKVMLGLRAREDLYMEFSATNFEAMTDDERKAALKEFAEKSGNAAQADEGSTRGTAHHLMVGAHHEHGARIGTKAMQQRLIAYERLLEEKKLEAVPGLQERVVVWFKGDVAGKFDNVYVCQRTGCLLIGDLKAQEKFYSMQEAEIQLAVYAHADALWNREKRKWEPMPRVRKDVGVIVHMDKNSTNVELKRVNIARGWRNAQLALEIVRQRSACKNAETMRETTWMLLDEVDVKDPYVSRIQESCTLSELRHAVDLCKAVSVWDENYREMATAQKNLILKA